MRRFGLFVLCLVSVLVCSVHPLEAQTAPTLAQWRTGWRDARTQSAADATERRRRAQRTRAVAALQSSLDDFLSPWLIEIGDVPVIVWHSEVQRRVWVGLAGEVPLFSIRVDIPVVDGPPAYVLTTVEGADVLTTFADLPLAVMNELAGELGARRGDQ